MNQQERIGDSEAAEYSGLRLSLIKVGLVFVWVSFCLLLLLLNSTFGWWVLLILAVPISLVAEWLVARVFASNYGWITLQVGFSIKRILFGLLLILGLVTSTYFVLRFVHLILKPL